MPKLSTSVTATTTTVVKLKPTVKRMLLTELKAYQALAAQLATIKHAMDVRKGKIGTLRESTGEDSISLDGFKVTRVTGTHSTLDKKKLVELGCAMAWIEEATTTKPKKAYEKVTCPGDKEEDE